jgi:hypothetical protein
MSLMIDPYKVKYLGTFNNLVIGCSPHKDQALSTCMVLAQMNVNFPNVSCVTILCVMYHIIVMSNFSTCLMIN